MSSSSMQQKMLRQGVATEPALLIDIAREWDMAQRAARWRLQFCYALASILLTVIIVLALYSTFVYLAYVGSRPAPTPEELAQARRSILGLCMLSAGIAAIFLAAAGLASALWVRIRHERPLGEVRRAADRENRFDVLRRSGGNIDHLRAQPYWETFRQHNWGFVVGYAVVIVVGVLCSVVGRLIR